MLTYFIYSFILFGSSISAFISTRTKSYTLKKVFIFFSFFIPFIFLAIRYDISFDYHNYVYIFYQIKDGHPGFREPLFVLINQIIAYLHLDVQWLFVFFSFWTLFFIYKAIPKQILPVAIFLYITNCYLYDDMDIIRQGLAVSIVIYALKYVYEKKIIKYLFFSIIAMGIHFFTGFIYIVLYSIISIRFNKFILISIIIISYILLIKLSLLENILVFFAKFSPKLSLYLNSAFVLDHPNVGTGLGIFIKMFLAILVVWYKDIMEKKYPRSYIFVNLYVLYIIAMLLHLKMSIFIRVEDMLIIGMIMSLSYFIYSQSGYGKILISIIVLVFYSMGYFRFISKATEENINDNLAIVNPYKTIFERDGNARVGSIRSGTNGK